MFIFKIEQLNRINLVLSIRTMAPREFRIFSDFKYLLFECLSNGIRYWYVANVCAFYLFRSVYCSFSHCKLSIATQLLISLNLYHLFTSSLNLVKLHLSFVRHSSFENVLKCAVHTIINSCVYWCIFFFFILYKYDVRNRSEPSKIDRLIDR